MKTDIGIDTGVCVANMAVLILVFCFGFIYAQNVPFGFNYQGVASDNNNIPYKDKNISLEISIINDIVGNVVYKEIHRNVKHDLKFPARPKTG